MKKITNFNIDLKDLSVVDSIRSFTVIGQENAEFTLQIHNSSGQFYNFTTKSFASGFNSENSLVVKMEGNEYVDSVFFPANASSDTFSFLLLAAPDKDTELELGGGKNAHTVSISRVANSTITFAPVSTSNSTYYQTFSSTGAASVLSTSSPTSTATVSENISWNVKNTVSDAKGFGFILARQPIDEDWFFTKTTDAASDSVGNKVAVTDLTNIVEGMDLTYTTGTTAPGAITTIISIDTSTNTLTLSRDQALSSGATMTFRAKGFGVINRAIESNIQGRSSETSSTGKTDKTVRADVGSSVNVSLTNTHGISGGGTVTVSGTNFINPSANTVQTVTADADGSGEDGFVHMQVAQNLKLGDKLYFVGSGPSVNIGYNFTINSYPLTSQIINLELDNFITPGAAS